DPSVLGRAGGNRTHCKRFWRPPRAQLSALCELFLLPRSDWPRGLGETALDKREPAPFSRGRPTASGRARAHYRRPFLQLLHQAAPSSARCAAAGRAAKRRLITVSVYLSSR